jgi:hypothetical protein
MAENAMTLVSGMTETWSRQITCFLTIARIHETSGDRSAAIDALREVEFLGQAKESRLVLSVVENRFALLEAP